MPFRLFLASLLLSLSVGSTAMESGPDHVGSITQAELLASHSAFANNYARFQPTENDLVLMQSLEGKRLVVLFGTWCHDSVREIPRLLKLLDESKVKLELALYGLDRRKKDPEDYSTKYGLKYTPTIILLDGDTELSRIIERPYVSLAQDLSQ